MDDHSATRGDIVTVSTAPSSPAGRVLVVDDAQGNVRLAQSVVEPEGCIVLVASPSTPRDRIRGIDAGADDFISKPFNPRELRARVHSLVRVKRYTDDLESVDERVDGSGYPDSLRIDAIPLLAHIMGIVDVYDAMTTARPDRQPRRPAGGYQHS